MGCPRYALSLTYDQLRALKEAFEGNFGGGYEEEGSKEEIRIGKRLNRLFLRAYRERQAAQR